MKKIFLLLFTLLAGLGSGYSQSLPPFPCDLLSVDTIQTSRINPKLIQVTMTNHDSAQTWGPTLISIIGTNGDTVGSLVTCGCVILFKGKTGTFNITANDTNFRVPTNYCASLSLTGSGSVCTKTYSHCEFAGLPPEAAESSLLRLFPSPAHDLITLDLGYTPAADAQLAIQNMQGRKVLSEPLYTQSTSLDLSRLAKGIYLVQVYEKGVLSGTKKMMVD